LLRLHWRSFALTTFPDLIYKARSHPHNN
jgi:hypothetical protein